MITRMAILYFTLLALSATNSFGRVSRNTLASSTRLNFLSPQSAKPAYLHQFPSVEEIKADVRGLDAMETAAKQAGIFWQLHQLISLLAYSQRRTERQFTRDEQRLEIEYRNAYYIAMEPFEGKVTGADKQRWFELHTKYEMDLWLRDEAFKKYFTPEFRSSVYVALKGQMPTEEAPSNSRLTAIQIAPTAPSTSTKNSTTQTLSSNQVLPPGSEGQGVPTVQNSSADPRSITSNNETAEAYVMQGHKLLEAKEYTKAAAVYRKAINLKPQLANAHFGLGQSLYNLEQFSAALPEFQKAAQLQPNDYKLHYWVGMTIGQIADAFIKEEANPTNMRVRIREYHFALQAFERAVKLKPDDLESQVQLGLSYSVLEMYEPALDTLKRARQLSPNDADINYLLGTAYMKLGMKSEALAVYRKLLTLDKEAAQQLYELINKSK